MTDRYILIFDDGPWFVGIAMAPWTRTSRDLEREPWHHHHYDGVI